MHKPLRDRTPAEIANRRVEMWVRRYKSGALHKVPALTQAQRLVLKALAGMLDNRRPSGPLTGRPRDGRLGPGPTVQSIATITGMTHRWATETLRWLAAPITDADGNPLDHRGAPERPTQPGERGGRRLGHTEPVIGHVPFVVKAGGGKGGGRRSRIWLHLAFFEASDEVFDALTGLPPWPYDPNCPQPLHGAGPPLRMGTGRGTGMGTGAEMHNTLGAAAAARAAACTADAGKVAAACPPFRPAAPGGGQAGQGSGVNVPTPPAPRAGVFSRLSGQKQQQAASPSGGPPAAAAQPTVQLTEVGADMWEGKAPGEQLAFLLDVLAAHGIHSYDVMAPDRVALQPRGKRESENINWRWTYTRADGSRYNTKRGRTSSATRRTAAAARRSAVTFIGGPREICPLRSSCSTTWYSIGCRFAGTS